MARQENDSRQHAAHRQPASTNPLAARQKPDGKNRDDLPGAVAADSARGVVRPACREKVTRCEIARHIAENQRGRGSIQEAASPFSRCPGRNLLHLSSLAPFLSGSLFITCKLTCDAKRAER